MKPCDPRSRIWRRSSGCSCPRTRRTRSRSSSRSAPPRRRRGLAFANELFECTLRGAQALEDRDRRLRRRDSRQARASFSTSTRRAYTQLHELGVHRVQRARDRKPGPHPHRPPPLPFSPKRRRWTSTSRMTTWRSAPSVSSSAGGQHMQKNDGHPDHSQAVGPRRCQDERPGAEQAQGDGRAPREDLPDGARQGGRRARGYTQRPDRLGRPQREDPHLHPQSRITDHRIGFQAISAFMDGDIQAMLDALTQDEQARKLAEMEEDGDGGAQLTPLRLCTPRIA